MLRRNAKLLRKSSVSSYIPAGLSLLREVLLPGPENLLGERENVALRGKEERQYVSPAMKTAEVSVHSALSGRGLGEPEVTQAVPEHT